MVMGRWEGKEGNGMVKKRVWVRGKKIWIEKVRLRDGRGREGG